MAYSRSMMTMKGISMRRTLLVMMEGVQKISLDRRGGGGGGLKKEQYRT